MGTTVQSAGQLPVRVHHNGRLSECSATGSLAQVAATSSLSKYKIMTIESLIIINSGLKSAHREN